MDDSGWRSRIRWVVVHPDRPAVLAVERAGALAEPMGALHHAVSYRSIVANLDPPIDLHMMQSTAYWLRKVIAGLRRPLL